MSHTAASVRSDAYLKQRWARLHHRNPAIRIRDAARQPATSEAQLVASSCGADVVRLRDDWSELLARLPSLGRMMALTRNEHAVHEWQGA